MTEEKGLTKVEIPASRWPKIPEIPVEFKSCDGGKVAHVVANLGILGEWEIGDIRMDEATLKEYEEDPTEFMDGCKVEIQHAFNRLILRIAAVALVKRGDGYAPLVAWYEDAQRELEG